MERFQAQEPHLLRSGTQRFVELLRSGNVPRCSPPVVSFPRSPKRCILWHWCILTFDLIPFLTSFLKSYLTFFLTFDLMPFLTSFLTWHLVWQLIWHLIWHLFRHFIWHLIWHRYVSFIVFGCIILRVATTICRLYMLHVTCHVHHPVPHVASIILFHISHAYSCITCINLSHMHHTVWYALVIITYQNEIYHTALRPHNRLQSYFILGPMT